MTSDETGSRVAAVIACYIVPIPLEILATSLRICAKQRQSHGGRDRFTVDDFIIVFATVGDRLTSDLSRLLSKPRAFCEPYETEPDLDL